MEKTRLDITGSSKGSVRHEMIWFGYDVSHYVVQADLELAMCPGLVSNQLRLLSQPSIGMTDIYYYAWLHKGSNVSSLETTQERRRNQEATVSPKNRCYFFIAPVSPPPPCAWKT